MLQASAPNSYLSFSSIPCPGLYDPNWPVNSLRHQVNCFRLAENLFPTSFWQGSVDFSTNYENIYNPSPLICIFIQIPEIIVSPQPFKLFYIHPSRFFFPFFFFFLFFFPEQLSVRRALVFTFGKFSAVLKPLKLKV